MIKKEKAEGPKPVPPPADTAAMLADIRARIMDVQRRLEIMSNPGLGRDGLHLEELE